MSGIVKRCKGLFQVMGESSSIEKSEKVRILVPITKRNCEFLYKIKESTMMASIRMSQVQK